MGGWLILGVLAGYGLIRVFARYPKPQRPQKRLAAREVAFLGSVSEAMYPPGGAIPPSGLEADIPGYLDAYLDVVPARMRILMRLLFFLMEHATVLFPAPGRGGRRRFSSLTSEQRVAVLEGWRSSRLFPRRLVFTSLRALLTMGYFADGAVLQVLGLAPYAIETPVVEADLLYPRVGQRPETNRLTRADLTPPSDGTPLAIDGPRHPAYAPAAAGRS